MTDGIIKGTGNSRFLKSVADIMTRYPTWDAAAAALRDGTFPIDLNGINELGWQVLATALNKANLLSDATAEKYDLQGNATVNDVLNILGENRCNTAFGSYVGTTNSSNYLPVTLSFPFKPKFVFVMGNENGTNHKSISYISVEHGYCNTNYNAGASTGSSHSIAALTVTENTISWSGRAYNANESGCTYYYVAIG